MRALWTSWVGLWAHREAPHAMALVRILLGLVILWDLLETASLGLVTPLYAPQEVGGWADVTVRDPWILPLAGPWHHGLLTLSAFFMTLGFFSRCSALSVLLLWAAHQHGVPEVDRAVDLLCRNLVAILVLSGAGRAWSVDAWMRGTTESIGSWARYLVIAQLVLMYVTAGLQKVGLAWLPMGDFTALFIILQDPAIARFDFAFLRTQPWFLLAQLGTVTTLAWQLAYPLVLLWLYFRATPDVPGRLRAFSLRWRLHAVWVGVGAVFHLVLAATTELGIFPWAMLAAYAAFADPAWLSRLTKRPRD